MVFQIVKQLYSFCVNEYFFSSSSFLIIYARKDIRSNLCQDFIKRHYVHVIVVSHGFENI